MHVELPPDTSAWCEACRSCCSAKRGKCRSQSEALAEAEGVRFTTRRPKWNQRLKAPTLDYGGRCQEASVRNFQLTGDPDGECFLEEIALMFGKVDAELFFVEFKDAISPVQAFALALTTASLS